MDTTTAALPTHTPTRVAFTPPEGYSFGYYVTREAWHAKHSIFDEDTNVLMVGLYGGTQGCEWEFAIDEELLPQRYLRVKMFDESWDAYVQIPEFFTALADLRAHAKQTTGGSPTVSDILAIFDTLGFNDLTARTQP